MKLGLIISKHTESSAAEGLSDSLGDSFLLIHNRIFSQIRRKALELGYSYSNDLSQDYLAFPMGQLETILKNKFIPYVNNVASLKSLSSRISLDWNHVVDNLKPNYVFHESCHAIARSLSPKTASVQEKITVMLIEESFANACEFLAIADVHDPAHRLFLEVNSYFTIFEDRTHLKNAIDKYGLSVMFKFMHICYLHSNFLNEQLNDSDFKKIVALCDFKISPENKVLKSLAQNAFALNPRFRYATTEMYLRLNDINTPINQALKFDYIKLISENISLRNFINQLTHIVESNHV